MRPEAVHRAGEAAGARAGAIRAVLAQLLVFPVFGLCLSADRVVPLLVGAVGFPVLTGAAGCVLGPALAAKAT